MYEGDFVDGKKTGKGKYTWADGNVYEGDYVDGKKTGKGKFTWADGNVYEGDFVDDKMRTGTFCEAAANTNGTKIAYAAEFTGGHEMRNDYWVYDATFSLHGQVVRRGVFSNGKFLQ